jgi:hypothetical protein
MGMIRRLVPLAVFNTVVPVINGELGSIPKRSRKKIGQWISCPTACPMLS